MTLPIQLLIGLVSAMLIAAGSYNFGRHVAEGEAATQQYNLAVAYAGEIRAEQGKADQLAADLSAARSRQTQKDRAITKEITRYVEVTAPDRRCQLPGTWRMRHDAAATGTPASPEAGPVADGSADHVEDAAALETIGENYQAARECFAKLIGWQTRQKTLEP